MQRKQISPPAAAFKGESFLPLGFCQLLGGERGAMVIWFIWPIVSCLLVTDQGLEMFAELLQKAFPCCLSSSLQSSPCVSPFHSLPRLMFRENLRGRPRGAFWHRHHLLTTVIKIFFSSTWKQCFFLNYTHGFLLIKLPVSTKLLWKMLEVGPVGSLGLPPAAQWGRCWGDCQKVLLLLGSEDIAHGPQ